MAWALPSDGIDPEEIRGPTNELLLAYASYNAFHQPGVITNAVNDVTTITYNDTNHRVIRIQWPSGLTTTNIYFTTGATNFLQQTKDLQTTNSISFTYVKSLVSTFTDARGLQVTLNWDALERLTNAVFPNGTIKKVIIGVSLHHRGQVFAFYIWLARCQATALTRWKSAVRPTSCSWPTAATTRFINRA